MRKIWWRIYRIGSPDSALVCLFGLSRPDVFSIHLRHQTRTSLHCSGKIYIRSRLCYWMSIRLIFFLINDKFIPVFESVELLYTKEAVGRTDFCKEPFVVDSACHICLSRGIITYSKNT